MYTVIFSPKAANQYADIIDFLSAGPKKLTTFEKEIESANKAIKALEDADIQPSLTKNWLDDQVLKNLKESVERLEKRKQYWIKLLGT